MDDLDLFDVPRRLPNAAPPPPQWRDDPCRGIGIVTLLGRDTGLISDDPKTQRAYAAADAGLASLVFFTLLYLLQGIGLLPSPLWLVY